MSTIIILGAGPSAIVCALILMRQGHQVLLIGQYRRQFLLEGASSRAYEALRRMGCIGALNMFPERWVRCSTWGGKTSQVNGEYVVERGLLDRLLIDDFVKNGGRFIEGMVLNTSYQKRGWLVTYGDSYQQAQRVEGDFLVEARGRSAPKTAPNQIAGPIGVALSRRFLSLKRGVRRTLTESFPEGWAWVTQDLDGKVSIQLIVDSETLREEQHCGLAAIHARLLSRHSYVSQELGVLKPLGEVSVRGVQPLLRGDLISACHLRLGDAAYCVDPLSGHGMYEAMAGAFAAAPAINTIITRPDLIDLACRFYEQRARHTFYLRCKAGVELYTNERRWSDEHFWAVRQNWNAGYFPEHNQNGRSVLVKPVVEQDLIVERQVIVTNEYPQGIRFLAGVELPALQDRLANRQGRLDKALLARELGVSLIQLDSALSWMGEGL
ncbi:MULTISPECIES: NAD(P)/FAD-dependent oxidoreductase [unclassified Pseudomonas]|uniref:flavin-dependent monooxygenase QhpG n=1 Tax=unclassified Pseudomonas TaxID=196821 RepID=UPI000CD29102|nr:MULTISPECIES: hypothetical protein [unclassified Pseudomonas]POA28201.1 hypothetical protein C1887_24955 [Pseudomonas sp. GW456-R21]POA62119.1 hypothetical protein C1884_27670 [Pseudomonas sp. GW460-R15]